MFENCSRLEEPAGSWSALSLFALSRSSRGAWVVISIYRSATRDKIPYEFRSALHLSCGGLLLDQNFVARSSREWWEGQRCRRARNGGGPSGPVRPWVRDRRTRRSPCGKAVAAGR